MITQTTQQLGIMNSGDVEPGVLGQIIKLDNSKLEEFGDAVREIKKVESTNTQPGFLTSQEITEALIENRIVPVLQPIIPATSDFSGNYNKRTAKYECLMRIVDNSCDENGELSLIPPSRFLDVLKKDNSLARKAAIMMMEKSLQIAKEQDISISLNFGDAEGEFPYLTKYLEERIRELNLKPGQVTIELLEDIRQVDFDTVAYLKDVMGLTLAIDDFGSGEANHKRVQEVACFVDVVKVDRNLVNGLVDDKLRDDSLHILSEMFELIQEEIERRKIEGNTGSIQVVFEGVEDADSMKATYELAAQFGVEAFWQGFGIQKPALPSTLFGGPDDNPPVVGEREKESYTSVFKPA